MSVHTFKLLGGPLDGMTLTTPFDCPIPSEIILRQLHCRPFWEGCYRMRPVLPAGPWITAEVLESPEWVFDYVLEPLTEGGRKRGSHETT